MAPRAYWKGHIRLSLVSFPVQLLQRHGEPARGSRSIRSTGRAGRARPPSEGRAGRRPGRQRRHRQGLRGREGQLRHLRAPRSSRRCGSRVEAHDRPGPVRRRSTRSTRSISRSPISWCPTGRWRRRPTGSSAQALRDSGKVALGQVVLSGPREPRGAPALRQGHAAGDACASADEVRKGAPYFAEIEDRPGRRGPAGAGPPS